MLFAVKKARDIRTQLYHGRGFIFVVMSWDALNVFFNKKRAMLACQKTHFQWTDICLAVFCAVGGLGKVVSRYIAHDSLSKESILIDLPNKINLLTKLIKNSSQSLLMHPIISTSLMVSIKKKILY